MSAIYTTTSDIVTELRSILDDLKARGLASRLNEPSDPDYYPYTLTARGLLTVMRRRGERFEASRIARDVARLLSDALRVIVSEHHREERIRADERSRVLASVADDLRDLKHHNDGAYEELASMYAAGRMPCEEKN